MVCGLGFAVMPVNTGRVLSGQLLFILKTFQEGKEQVLPQSQRAADGLGFTLCSSLSPSSSSSDLKMCKQRLDVVGPMLFKPQWSTKLSLSTRQHDSRKILLCFPVDTFAAASRGSSSRGAVDALLDSLSSEAHFFPGHTGFWTTNLLPLIPWLLVSLLILRGKSLHHYLQGLI